jgi:hypothetical protein
VNRTPTASGDNLGLGLLDAVTIPIDQQQVSAFPSEQQSGRAPNADALPGALASADENHFLSGQASAHDGSRTTGMRVNARARNVS